jgi:hypothetical protein
MTRLAGLLIGRTNEAALAIKAQIGKRVLSFRRACDCRHGRREHDRRCIVGQEYGDDRADQIDERKQPRGGATGMRCRLRGQPVEEALLPGDLSQQHHSEQEQIDIRAVGDTAPGFGCR